MDSDSYRLWAPEDCRLPKFLACTAISVCLGGGASKRLMVHIPYIPNGPRSKYPTIRYLPKTIITIPNTEALNTLIIAWYCGPSGILELQPRPSRCNRLYDCCTRLGLACSALSILVCLPAMSWISATPDPVLNRRCRRGGFCLLAGVGISKHMPRDQPQQPVVRSAWVHQHGQLPDPGRIQKVDPPNLDSSTPMV